MRIQRSPTSSQRSEEQISSRPKAPAAFVCTPVMDLKMGQLMPAMQDARRDNPHLGVFLLIGHLKRAGLECDLLDWVADSHMTADQLAASAACYQVVFFSSNSMNWGAVRLVAKKIRELGTQTKLCVGGPHPTMYPQSVEKSDLFDAYYRGEDLPSTRQAYPS